VLFYVINVSNILLPVVFVDAFDELTDKISLVTVNSYLSYGISVL